MGRGFESRLWLKSLFLVFVFEVCNRHVSGTEPLGNVSVAKVHGTGSKARYWLERRTIKTVCGFESHLLDYICLPLWFIFSTIRENRGVLRKVAQWIRASRYEREGRGFESCLSDKWKYSQAATAAVCKTALFGVRRFESFCFHSLIITIFAYRFYYRFQLSAKTP